MRKLPENVLFFIKASLCIIATFLISQLAKGHYDPGRESAIWISSFAILLSVSIFWELRRFLGFWIAVGIVAAFHLLIVVMIPWPTPPPESGRGLGFIAAIDAGVICGIFTLVQRSVIKTISQDSEGKGPK